MNCPSLRPYIAALLLVGATAVSLPATPEEKLAELKLTLPTAFTPVHTYVPTVRTGNLVFVAGHVSRHHDGKVIAGKLGRDLDEKQGAAAARQTALWLIATLKRDLGDLSRIKRIVRVGGFVNCTDNFTTQPIVINGCSDLLVAVFGERGRHARAALGTNALPLGAAVEIEMVVEVE